MELVMQQVEHSHCPSMHLSAESASVWPSSANMTEALVYAVYRPIKT